MAPVGERTTSPHARAHACGEGSELARVLKVSQAA